METTALIVEQLYHAPISRIWEALTINAEMKKWYFDLEEFKPEVGFKFQFYGSKDDTRYLHLCKIVAVIPGKKLSYTWSYDHLPGESTVSFELFEAPGGSTNLKLSHSGLESFVTDNPDFARGSFEQGWKHILGTSLKNFLEKG